MSEKQTGILHVLAKQSFTEKELVINPNDGFDLGLMMTETTVELLFSSEPDKEDDQNSPTLTARLFQKNECKPGTIELSLKSTKKLNGKMNVRLSIEETENFPKILISPV